MLILTEGFIIILLLFVALPVSILLLRDFVLLLMGKPRRLSLL